MVLKRKDKEIFPKGITYPTYSVVIISIALSIVLTVTALSGKEIAFEYGDFRVEINHSHLCKLPLPNLLSKD